MTPTNSWTPLDIDTPAAPSVPRPGPGTHVVAFVAAEEVRSAGWSPRAALEIARGWGAAGSRVVLFDVGLEDPSLHLAAGLDNLEGVSDALMFGTSFQRLAQPLSDGLFLATAGTAVPNAEALRAHPRWRDFMDGFRGADALLVLYLPSGAPGSEDLLRRCDAVVVLADQTEVESVEVSGSLALLASLGPPSGTPPVQTGPGAADMALGKDALREDDPAWADAPLNEAEDAPSLDESPEPAWADTGAEELEVAGLEPEPKVEPDEEEAGFVSVDEGRGEDDFADAFLAEDPLAPGDPLSLQGDPLVGELGEGPELAGSELEPPPEELAAPPTLDEILADGDVDVPAPPAEAVAAAEMAPEDAASSEAPRAPEVHDALGEPEWAGAAADLGPAPGADELQAAGEPRVHEEPTPSEMAAAVSRTRRKAEKGGSGQLWMLVVLLLILAVLVAARLGFVNLPVITPSPEGGLETAAAAEVTPAGGSDAPTDGAVEEPAAPVEALPGESPVAAFVLALGAFSELDDARNRAAVYNLRLPTVQFIVAPVEVDGRSWYRLLAGPAQDTAELAMIRNELRAARTGSSQDWIIREARMAYLVGSAPRLPLAERNVEILSELGIPAHVLRYTNAEGSTVFRVYAGAYADSAEAAFLGQLLAENSIRNAPLTERRGIRPE